MQTRHRTPSVFNISMVDVLCCALGCVILLWLLNLRDAKEKAATVGSTSTLLARSRMEVTDLQARLAAAESQVQKTRADLDEARRRADALAQDLTAARARLAALGEEADKLKLRSTTAEDRLAQLTDQQREALLRLRDLQAMLRDKEKLAAKVGLHAQNLADQLKEAEARARQMQALADLVPGLRKELQAYRGKLQAADERARGLEEELDDRKKALSDRGQRLEALQRDRQALSEEIERARAAADNRFAGIELTGKRVVFLIDMSGSMELLDRTRTAPDKWLGVRETLLKLMRSLPDLEKFQVILFSDRLVYPLGAEGQWIDFDPRTSMLRVVTSMAAVRPQGETNMYLGLDAAFRYRSQGLDTLYVLSDGLPSTGEGLPTSTRALTDREKSESLSQHIRRTLKARWNAPNAGQARVRINAIGFFYESPDVGAFLWALARENDGSFVGMSKP
jgi:predicted  nucleic acid-binding Zn-ribbon protein